MNAVKFLSQYDLLTLVKALKEVVLLVDNYQAVLIVDGPVEISPEQQAAIDVVEALAKELDAGTQSGPGH
jgi:hypothetical protein